MPNAFVVLELEYTTTCRTDIEMTGIVWIADNVGNVLIDFFRQKCSSRLRVEVDPRAVALENHRCTRACRRSIMTITACNHQPVAIVAQMISIIVQRTIGMNLLGDQLEGFILERIGL